MAFADPLQWVIIIGVFVVIVVVIVYVLVGLVRTLNKAIRYFARKTQNQQRYPHDLGDSTSPAV